MKKTFKGSEGKWGCVFTSDKKRAVRNKGGLICILTEPSRFSGQDERYDNELQQMRANQRLISYAPEMFELLSELENDDNSIPKWLWERIQKVLDEAST